MAKLPHIAILGRPNVGKSTLFNRLVGRRTAIVDPTPGVTRDRIEGEFDWEGRNFRVSDLAGWDEDPSNPFAKETTEQIQRISTTADVILLVVDANDGPTAWDSALAEKLRIVPTPVILVVNKCDTVQASEKADQFWELGIGEPIPISATHNLNVDVMLDRISELTVDFDADEEEDEPEDTITVAVLGKQNAGKSTLFNRIVGDSRAIVSDIPGTTRDAIDTAVEIDGQRYLFIDTAGMKKRTKISEDVDFYAIRRTTRALERSEIALLLVDVTEGITDTDRKIANLIGETGRACVLVASKWDESEDAPGQRGVFIEHLRERLYFVYHTPVIFTSGLKNMGIKDLFPAIISVHDEFHKKIPTSDWNRALADAVEFRPPPSIRGKRLKLNYVTQTGTAPPRLSIFVNQPDFVRDQYKRYLERYFRRRFGFDGVPIIMNFRRKKKDRTDR